MKVTKEKAAQNRSALVQAAGRLFRERGIDGVGVAEICKAAGLTHGALYAQFPSKHALAAAALAQGLEHSLARIRAATDSRRPMLSDYLDFYMARSRRDNIAGACPMTASASEIARQDAAVSARFSEGFERTIETVQAALGVTGSSATARERALTIVTAMIGGIAVSRAVRQARPRLSNEILAAVRHVVGEVGGESTTPKRRDRAGGGLGARGGARRAARQGEPAAARGDLSQLDLPGRELRDRRGRGTRIRGERTAHPRHPVP